MFSQETKDKKSCSSKMNNHDVLPLHMANSKNKVHLIVTNHVLRFGVDAQLKMQILKWFQLYFAFINYYCPQHPRATAITFEFGRHIFCEIKKVGFFEGFLQYSDWSKTLINVLKPMILLGNVTPHDYVLWSKTPSFGGQ